MVSEESTPSTNVGTPQTQRKNLEIRREETIRCTAKAMQFGLTVEELEDVIAKNASGVEMDPEELRDLAIRYNLEYDEANSNGIETE